MAARRDPFVNFSPEVLEEFLRGVGPDALNVLAEMSDSHRRYIRDNAERLPQRALRINLDLRNGQGEVVNRDHPLFRIVPAAHRPMRLRALRSGRVERVRIHSIGGHPVAAPTAARRLFRYRRYLRGAAVNIVDMPGNVAHCTSLLRACAMASHVDITAPPTRSANWFADAAGAHLYLVHSVFLTRMHTFDPLALVEWLLAPSNSSRAVAIAIGCPLTYEAFWHLVVRITDHDVLVQHRVQLLVDERPATWGILPIELQRLQNWAERGAVQNPRTLVRWTFGRCVTGATLTIDP